MEITHTAVHHAGGLGANRYASTQHITVKQINSAHKARWNFPSKFIPNSYAGYNFIYTPYDRKFTQTRAIGEETAAQIGWNLNTISLCIVGNYTALPNSQTVDPMTKEIEEDVAEFIFDLINGSHSWVIAPNTKIDLSLSRVHPHRWYGHTECYGTGLSDKWLTDLLAAYKKPPQEPLQKRVALLKKLVSLYLRLLSLQDGGRIKASLGSDFEHRECPGHLTITNTL